MKRSCVMPGLGWLILMASTAAGAGTVEPTCTAPGAGDTRAVVAAVDTFRNQLSDAERAKLEKPLIRDNAIHWSNLPLAIVPRDGLRLGDLDVAKNAAARAMLAAALSACGLTLFDEIRLADDALIPLDTRKIGWDARNYFLTLLGTPSVKTPWMLQVGGHHLAYNFTFNGKLPGATPLFFGTEPIRFTLNGSAHEPLDRQSAAMSQVATAISAYPQAKLSGTFTDVVKGVVVVDVPGHMPTGGIDTGFPQSYPPGEADRGVRYSALTPAQQALVRAALETYTGLPGRAISQPLVKAYESPAALADTFVGFAGATDLSAKGSYVRIDGPRIWMEFVVQPAVAKPTELHYHALWRDKQSDYGGEIGQ